ncbi:hypothetical protein, partial [Burkholderia sp.]|uniref:hypothetical protein n=1 Tax=Burkholderia sp. TaxID=36773 RepID=UPI0025C52638
VVARLLLRRSRDVRRKLNGNRPPAYAHAPAAGPAVQPTLMCRDGLNMRNDWLVHGSADLKVTFFLPDSRS